MRTTLLSLAFAGLLAACANGPTRSAPRPVAPPLLAPATLGASVQVQQLLHAAYGNDEATLQCVVSDDDAMLSVVCLTAMGQRVFTLDYDGRGVQARRAPLAPDTIDPERIVADLQLAYWPLAALQPVWQNAGYSISEPRPGLRRVLRDGKLYAEVHRAQPALISADGSGWTPRLWLVNFAYGYSLDIETQDAGR